MSGTDNSSKDKRLLNVTPVILAGGMGARLRPLTSPSRPKPFLRIPLTNSLFQDTLARAQGMASPVIVCYAPFADRVFEHCYEMGIRPAAIICEPAQRGTAAAVACAAHYLKDSGTRMLVMPSDHALEGTLFDAVANAPQTQDFVLFGAKPSELSERYGYIVVDRNGEFKRFVEKPARHTIAALAQEGKVLWNTGIFMSSPRLCLDYIQKLQPALYAATERAVAKVRRDGVFVFPAIDSFVESRGVSIDVAVMEHLRTAKVVAINQKWADVGTLPAFLQAQWGKIIQSVVKGV